MQSGKLILMNPFEPKVRQKIIDLYFNQSVYCDNIAERFNISLRAVQRIIELERKKRNVCQGGFESARGKVVDQHSHA